MNFGKISSKNLFHFILYIVLRFIKVSIDTVSGLIEIANLYSWSNQIVDHSEFGDNKVHVAGKR